LKDENLESILMTKTASHYLLLDRDETVKKMMDLEKIIQKLVICQKRRLRREK